MPRICSPRRGAATAVLVGLLVALGLIGKPQAQTAAQTDATATSPTSAAGTLRERIEALDRELFEAFNRCELDKLANFFDPALEFYHDNSGVTWGREQFIADVKTNVCGKFSRKLVAGSLEVWPIGTWGAVYSGTHHFCPVGAARCAGSGRFLHIWQNMGGEWRITRVVSYDHRALP